MCEPGLDVADSAACSLTSHSQPLILYPSLITPAYYHPSSCACTSLHMIEVSMLLTVSYDEWVNSNRLKHDVSQPVETFLIRIRLRSIHTTAASPPVTPIGRPLSSTHTGTQREHRTCPHIYIEASSHNCVYTYIVGHDTRDTQSRGCTLRQRCVHTLIWVCRRVETGIL